MNGRLTLTDLLAVEADPQLWAPACPVSGVPYWHLIRGPMLRMIISDKFYDSAIVAASSSAAPRMRMLKTALRSLTHNLLAQPQKVPILVMATAMGVIRSDEGWINRLADHFVTADPAHTNMIEDQFQWQWRAPRAVPPTLFHVPLQASCVLSGRLLPRARYRRAAHLVISMARRRAAETVGFELDDERANALTSRLTARASELPHLFRAYTQLLKRLGTRILLKEEASYGGSSALMAAANALGITTAEYQHGLISDGHDAYNFAPEIQDLPALRKCLPQYLLTYGDWWNHQMSTPVMPIAVGNPHRSYALGRLPKARERSDVVLFLGDGLDTQASLAMAQEIDEAIRPANLRLIFRPHPIERARIAELGEQGVLEVEIDTIADINAAMSGTAAVVGETSTGLYEAIGLSARVLVWNTPKAEFTLGRHPFETFASAPDLAARLAREPSQQDNQSQSKIWAPDWQQRYTAFLAQHGAPNLDGVH